jgi:heterodisulfide reductase subunit A-like polyferredoxin
MKSSDTFSDSVLVVGGGIAGIQAALDLADSNRRVVLVEKSPSIGGRMAQLDKTFPTNDCSMCILAPKLIAVNRHSNIDLLTNSEVLEVEGEAGNFNIRVQRKPRYIDEIACIGCGECAVKCPVSIPSEFNQALSDRKAAYIPFPQAVPLKYSLERMAASPCKVSCPANLSAQGYVALIAEGRYDEALQVVKDVMPFAGTIGRVCDHKCEFSCKRDDYEGSVSIRALKRFIADKERESGEIEPPRMLAEPNGRKVAVVGGGCAGLTCAYHLIRLGYEPTVYEAQKVTGGMLRLGIPDYRLPHEVLQAEIDDIEKMGVVIKTGMRAGKDFQIKELFDQGYEAVFIAVGLHNSIKLNVDGEDADGVMNGVAFLRDAALESPIKLGEKVIVIGGGNVAVDVARSARRLGAKKVDMVCLETRSEMPAHSWEVEEAEDEGVTIHNSWGPLKFNTDNGKVIGVELKSCTSVFDAEGKFCPEYDESNRTTMDADAVIVAIGQSADLDFLNGYVEVGRGISVDENQSTNVTGVFAGGDVTYGPKMAIDAINSGRMAAWAIDKYLNDGKNSAEPPLIERVDLDTAEYYKPDDIDEAPRKKLALIPSDERVKDFREIEECYSEEDAKAEASRCLSCGICARCGLCEVVCEANAVRYDDSEKIAEYKVGSIVLAPGYECFDPSVIDEYGYSQYRDVVTALEFERILSASGPYAGHIQRLSDGKDPKKIAFIQCVGSRDRNHGNPYCSSVCCMYTIKEAVIAKEHSPELDITVYYMDIRAFGKEFDYYYNRAKDEVGINFVRSRVANIERLEGEGGSDQLKLNYTGEDDEIKSDIFDMVVLSTGLVPNHDTLEFAKTLDVNLNEHSYCGTELLTPLDTSRKGVYVCGAFSEPKDIPETIAQASGAAGTAMLYTVPRSPEEMTSSDAEGGPEMLSPDVWAPGEPPRIGVIVCNCGINIGKVVRVSDVAEYAKNLPGVVISEDALYSCSQDVQERIKKLILENKLNRFVVASCTPRTHEPLFQETLKEVGLNPYLFELVNIREHCSWVHSNEPEKATDKSMDLVRKAVARVAMLEPLEKAKLEIVKSALVIGAGPAGMTAAAALGDLGYKVHLQERTGELGGNLRALHKLPDGSNPQEYLEGLTSKVTNHENITIYRNTEIRDISGHIGHFTTSFKHTPQGSGGPEEELIDDGVIIVATGGMEYQPVEFHHNDSEKVMSMRMFESKLSKNEVNAKSVVMVNCIGSRSKEYGWCSRVCCNMAIKDAMFYKEKVPDGQVYILFKDIRTYGFKEEYYENASAAGIRFIRYDDDNMPKLELTDSGNLKMIVHDFTTGEELELDPDLCVLSAGIHPDKSNGQLSEMLKVPLNTDGFFLEAHMKLRPVDFYTEGVFLCGLAHSPKNLSESLAQAYGASSAELLPVLKEKSVQHV